MKFVVLLIIVIGVGIAGGIILSFYPNERGFDTTKTGFQNNKMELEPEGSLFKRFTNENAFVIKDEKKIWYALTIESNPEYSELYNEFLPKENTVVIFPSLTASAYGQNNSFNYYFMGVCKERCLTVDLSLEIRPEASGNIIQILNLLGYQFIDDTDLDKNPEGLQKYDSVIVLNNEYVTKNEFTAITNHPNVLYLNPKALSAQVEINYEDETVTLISAPNFPPDTKSGFNWKHLDYDFAEDIDCEDWEFIEIDNGAMINCDPNEILHKEKELLKAISDF